MSLLRFLVAVLIATGMARAEPVTWNFTGTVVACPSTPELQALVTCNGPLHGALTFDDAAAPSASGQWPLAGSQFHAVIGGLTLVGSGDNAEVWPNQDGITFNGTIDGTTPLGLHGHWEISLVTTIDGYFDLDHLPADPATSDPAEWFWVDQTMAVWLGVPHEDYYIPDLIGTDTQFALAREVPEPSPLALYFGLGVILISIRRFLGSAALATRKLTAPNPLTVRRPAATP